MNEEETTTNITIIHFHKKHTQETNQPNHPLFDNGLHQDSHMEPTAGDINVLTYSSSE